MIAVAIASSDAAADLARLHASSFDKPWSVESFRSLLTQPGTLAVIARDQDPLGCGVFRVAADEVEILTLAVLPDARRRGVARAIVQLAFSAAHQRGAVRCFLEVADDNQAAIELYLSLGFAPCGRRAGYYDRGAERVDAVLYERMIVP